MSKAVGISLAGLLALGFGGGCSSDTGSNNPTPAFPAEPQQQEPPCDNAPPPDYPPLAVGNCAGSPQGSWSFKQINPSGIRLPVLPQCPLTVKPPDNLRFVLQLLDDGSGNLSVSGLEVKARGEYECLRNVTADYHCIKAGCGLVECVVPPAEPLPTSTFTWTLESSGTLLLRTSQGQRRLRYCVDGDIMTVDFDVGWEMQLERAPQ